MSHRQSIEELLQANSRALLPRMRGPLHQVTFVVKHQLGAHLAGLMTCHHTEVAGEAESQEILALAVTNLMLHLNSTAYLASVAVKTCNLRAHKELRASPLKPNVSTWMRSEKSLSFDV